MGFSCSIRHMDVDIAALAKLARVAVSAGEVY